MHVRLYLLSFVSLVIVATSVGVFVSANWYDYRTTFGGRPQIEQAVADGWEPVPGTVNAAGVSFYYRRPHLAIGQLFHAASVDPPTPARAVTPPPAPVQNIANCPSWTTASSKSVTDPC